MGGINRSPCVIIGVTEAGQSPWENPVGNFSHNRKKLQIHQGLDKKRACSVIFKKVGVDYYYEAEAWQSPWKNAASFYI